MSHMDKYQKADAKRLLGHYARKETEGGDKTYRSCVEKKRSYLNYNLAPKRNMTDSEYLELMLNEVDHMKTDRLVVMADFIVPQPKELDPQDSELFFQTVYDFCVDRYGRISGLGEDVVISAYVHCDETTKHIHFAFVPVIQKQVEEVVGVDEFGKEIVVEKTRQRFGAKYLISRKELTQVHRDLQKWLDDRGIANAKVLNGKTKRNKSGKAYTVDELKREKHLEENRWHNKEVDSKEQKKSRW